MKSILFAMVLLTASSSYACCERGGNLDAARSQTPGGIFSKWFGAKVDTWDKENQAAQVLKAQEEYAKLQPKDFVCEAKVGDSQTRFAVSAKNASDAVFIADQVARATLVLATQEAHNGMTVYKWNDKLEAVKSTCEVAQAQ